MMTKIWKDALHMKHALRCVQSVQPDRWREVVLELRLSRRFRRQFLSQVRRDLTFQLSCRIQGIPL